MSVRPELATRSADRREPDDLQREAEAIRADLGRTLAALERRLSPKQLLDRSLDYVQANGGDVLQKIGAAVNRNPVPILLTSAGLLWIAASSRKSHKKPHFEGPSAAPRSGDFDRPSQSFDGSSRAQRTANRIKQRASRTYDTTRERTAEVGHALNDLIQEQPLVCGAVALAIGALLGAALPATDYERDLVARARDSAGPLLDDVSQALRNKDAGAQPTSH
jgi:hypothetical protein